MDKSKTILREGYLFREEKPYGQAEALYCVLKAKSLSFHRRKVHKRHTPLGLVKLNEVTVRVRQDTDNLNVSMDRNHNMSRFAWEITNGDAQMFFYCANLEERLAWVASIEKARENMLKSCEDIHKESVVEGSGVVQSRTDEVLVSNSEKQLESLSVDSPQLSANTVDVVQHFPIEVNNGVRIASHSPISCAKNTVLTRVRSRSLCEVQNEDDVILANQEHVRSFKSKSAPPDSGKRGFKTVDKLIDVHSGFCKQLVKWI